MFKFLTDIFRKMWSFLYKQKSSSPVLSFENDRQILNITAKKHILTSTELKQYADFVSSEVKALLNDQKGARQEVALPLLKQKFQTVLAVALATTLKESAHPFVKFFHPALELAYHLLNDQKGVRQEVALLLSMPKQDFQTVLAVALATTLKESDHPFVKFFHTALELAYHTRPFNCLNIPLAPAELVPTVRLFTVIFIRSVIKDRIREMLRYSKLAFHHRVEDPTVNILQMAEHLPEYSFKDDKFGMEVLRKERFLDPYSFFEEEYRVVQGEFHSLIKNERVFDEQKTITQEAITILDKNKLIEAKNRIIEAKNKLAKSMKKQKIASHASPNPPIRDERESFKILGEIEALEKFLQKRKELFQKIFEEPDMIVKLLEHIDRGASIYDLNQNDWHTELRYMNDPSLSMYRDINLPGTFFQNDSDWGVLIDACLTGFEWLQGISVLFPFRSPVYTVEKDTSELIKGWCMLLCFNADHIIAWTADHIIAWTEEHDKIKEHEQLERYRDSLSLQGDGGITIRDQYLKKVFTEIE